MPIDDDNIRPEADQLPRQAGQLIVSASSPSIFDREVLCLGIAELSQCLTERVEPRRQVRSRAGTEIADPIHLPGRLRLGAERRGEEACRRNKEGPSVHHLMTSSARASTEGGIVRPSALAVLKLMTSSNFVGCALMEGRRAWLLSRSCPHTRPRAGSAPEC